MTIVKTFEQISKDDLREVGGKGASLGELTRIGLPVPAGFVITTRAYKRFVNRDIPDDVVANIIHEFEKLGIERVAVRSSAVAEDSDFSSWAGQLDTYLNVSKEDLIRKVKDCWNSIQSEKALSYIAEWGLWKHDLSVAVVVQKMIESEVSGVMFTVNPITQNRHEIMIEAGYGLGEMVVQGVIIPDNFLIDKNSLEIKERNIDTQNTMLIYKDGENKEVPVPINKKSIPSLNDAQVKELAELSIVIENHYGRPQDIEWALKKDKFYILQSRAITTLSD